MAYTWSDVANGFVADPNQMNELGHKVEELDGLVGGQFQWALKTLDETINNSNTLQNDDVLFGPVVASATYDIELWMLQNTNASANFKLDIALPSGAVWQTGHFDCNHTQVGQMTTNAITGITGTGADAYVMIHAAVVIGSTAGTVQVRWAQNVAHASNAIVRAASRLKLTRVA